MFKFLRKYSKWILAVFGTLLMVVFLVPQAITRLSQTAAQKSAVWATVGENNEKVTRNDLTEAQTELRILQRVQLPVPGFGLMDNPAHWFLLVREAEQAGVVGGRALDQIPPEALGRLMALAEQSNPLVVDRTLSRLMGVTRLLDLYQSAAKVSDHRLRAHARRLFHSVDARMVPIVAAARDDTPEPTEQQILEQFEAYKDVDPETGERGFGYRMPNRFKLEWLTIPTQSVRELVENNGQLNGVELFKHWKRYENDETRNFPPVEAGAEIPAVVRQDLLDELVVQKRDEIRKFASDRLLATWRRLPLAEGYYDLGESWDQERIGYPDLAAAVQEKFPGLALPIYEAVGDRWLTVDDARSLEGFGMLFTYKYDPRRRTSPADIVAKLKEFGGDNAILVQQDVTGPVLSDTDDSVIFFRVTDTDPSRPPYDVEEVRELVVEDLKRKADFERLLADMDRIEQQARTDGLLAVAIDHETEIAPSRGGVTLYNVFILDQQLQANYPLSPFPSTLPLIGQDVPTIEKIIDRALTFGDDVKLADLPAADRIFVVPVDDKMTMLVVELTEQHPLDEGHYETLASNRSLQNMILGEELNDVEQPVATAFSFETMMARHNFKFDVPEADEETEGEAEEGETETATAASADAPG